MPDPVSVFTCVLIGFMCLLVYRLSEYVRLMPYPNGQRRVKPIVKQQTAEEYKAEVDEVTTRTCPECSTPFVGKKCGTCDYVPPISFRTARKSFASIKKNLEGATR